MLQGVRIADTHMTNLPCIVCQYLYPTNETRSAYLFGSPFGIIRVMELI
jgi:hypothetical protein